MSIGVSRRFIELFKEKVERERYKYKNREDELSLAEVRDTVIGYETTRAFREYGHLIPGLYPREDPAQLLRHRSDALFLHNSWHKTGVEILDAIDECFSHEIQFIGVDFFNTVYEVELPAPAPEAEDESEHELDIPLTDDEETLVRAAGESGAGASGHQEEGSQEFGGAAQDTISQTQDARDDGSDNSQSQSGSGSEGTRGGSGLSFFSSEADEDEVGSEVKHEAASPDESKPPGPQNQSGTGGELKLEYLDESNHPTDGKPGADKVEENQTKSDQPTLNNIEEEMASETDPQVTASACGKDALQNNTESGDGKANDEPANVENPEDESSVRSEVVPADTTESHRGESEGESRQQTAATDASDRSRAKRIVFSHSTIFMLVDIKAPSLLLSRPDFVEACHEFHCNHSRWIRLMLSPQDREMCATPELYGLYWTSYQQIMATDYLALLEPDEAEAMQLSPEAGNEISQCVKSMFVQFLLQCVRDAREEVTSADPLALDLSHANWLIEVARSEWENCGREAAIELLKKAVAIEASSNGSTSMKNIATLRLLTDWYHAVVDRPGAIGSLRRIIEITESNIKASDLTFSPLHTELGHTYDGNGDLHEALESHLRALVVEEMNRGPSHPDVATTLNNVALVQLQLMKTEEAMASLDKARAIRESVFGVNHLKTAELYSNIGDVFMAEKKHVKALRQYNLAKDIRENDIAPEDDSSNLRAIINHKIGLAHMERCDFNQAVPAFEMAVIEFKRHHEYGGATNSEYWLGKALHSRSSYREALRLYRGCLRLYEKQADRTMFQLVAADIGLLYQETGEFSKARDMFLKLVQLQEDIHM